MEIEFAPHIVLKDSDKCLVMNWSTMRDQIAAREENGFLTSKVLINGVSLVGQEEKRRPLLVQARVFYSTPEAGETSYHTTFIPDAATLLVVFRVAERETTSNPEYSLDQHYVLMVEQSRYGMNERKSREVSGGLSEDANPAVTALREAIEEAAAGESQALIILSGFENKISLGPPVSSHPALTDRQFQYALNVDVSLSQFDTIKPEFDGSQAGNSSEQEQTRVTVSLLKDAFLEAVEHGRWTLGPLTRYMMKYKLLQFAK